MSHPPASLADRFRAGLAATGVEAGDALLTAVSGGCDSLVLLHLLRFEAGRLAPRLTVAHFDHAMRPDSATDAEWLAGVCGAWGLPLVVERAAKPLRGETAARRARYDFLHRAAAGAGARWIATAHHADDQAETVLFRAVRGSGLRGLAGIAPVGPAGRIRPLLPLWRREIRAYARAVGLRWRTDPSNQRPDGARNRLRLRILPALERGLAPAARRSLVRLAALAREDEAAWDAAVERLAGTATRVDGAHLLLDRAAFRGFGAPLAARVLRGTLRPRGIVLDRVGTRAAIQFITGAPSGRMAALPGGVRLHAEPDVVRLARWVDPVPDLPLRLDATAAARGGTGEVRIGGRARGVEWRRGSAPGPPGEGVALRWDRLRFPVQIRGRGAGDRISTPGGTKTLKKLLIERRVPRLLRPALPLVVAARGEVVWVAGLMAAAGLRAEPGDDALLLRISDD